MPTRLLSPLLLPESAIMNDLITHHTLSAVRPRSPGERPLADRAVADVRLTLADRIELRLGTWLLLRGARRRARGADRALAHRRFDTERTHVADVRHAERVYRLLTPPY